MNEEIERLRLSTMSSLFARRDVVVVASVSCIYGIGSREDYEAMLIHLQVGHSFTRERMPSPCSSCMRTSSGILYSGLDKVFAAVSTV